MNQIKTMVLLLLCLTINNTIASQTNSTSEETLYFDIVYNNKTIGSLKATKTSNDSLTYYQSSTTIETRIIKKINVNHEYNVTFNGNMLKTSNVDITINDKPHAKTFTKKSETGYQVLKNEKDKETVKDPIYYATVLLYFTEPKHVDRCYSEQTGNFNTIIALGNHAYKKVNSKERENNYYYKNGLLKRASIDGGLIKFDIIARNK
ncbi:DUF6134 family protein [Winogradskyella damuponensis]|uniref:Uncharacterized protein n=1 Tax=Winogradskyella damuponensis TaxID=943939 RepID=A0ABP8CNJ0_9FLAO